VSRQTILLFFQAAPSGEGAKILSILLIIRFSGLVVKNYAASGRLKGLKRLIFV
jgi:hypothetical protein